MRGQRETINTWIVGDSWVAEQVTAGGYAYMAYMRVCIGLRCASGLPIID